MPSALKARLAGNAAGPALGLIDMVSIRAALHLEEARP
jgi:hypothetical protein